MSKLDKSLEITNKCSKINLWNHCQAARHWEDLNLKAGISSSCRIWWPNLRACTSATQASHGQFICLQVHKLAPESKLNRTTRNTKQNHLRSGLAPPLQSPRPEPHLIVNIRCVVLGQKIKAANRQPNIFISHKIVVTLNYLTINNLSIHWWSFCPPNNR